MPRISVAGSITDILTGAGVSIVADTYTSSDDFATGGIVVKSFNFIGLAIDVDVETAGSLGIALEVSFDGGTVYYNLPNDANSQTQAALASITTSGQYFEYWGLPSPHVTDNLCLVRAQLDFGASSDIDIDQAKWVLFAPTN